MIEKAYIHNGKQGFNYSLEDGDEFSHIEVTSRDAKYGKIYTCRTADNKYVKLTGGQFKFFDRFKPEPGTLFRCESYDNSYGTFVGIRFADENDMNSSAPVVASATAQSTVATQVAAGPGPTPVVPASGLPVVNTPTVDGVLTNDEMTVINQLVGSEHYKPYREYAKESPIKFLEAMSQIAKDLGVVISLNGDRLVKANELFISKL